MTLYISLLWSWVCLRTNLGPSQGWVSDPPGPRTSPGTPVNSQGKWPRVAEWTTNPQLTPQTNNKRLLVDALPWEEGLEKNQALPLLSGGLSTSTDVAIFVSVKQKERDHDTWWGKPGKDKHLNKPAFSDVFSHNHILVGSVFTCHYLMWFSKADLPASMLKLQLLELQEKATCREGPWAEVPVFIFCQRAYLHRGRIRLFCF